MNNTLKLTWEQIQPLWNASSDKRYQECLDNTEAPCIIDHELTRYEYFEQEFNVSLDYNIHTKTYTLAFNTEHDVTLFVLKWL
jgi:hypothetical protein